MSEIVKGDVLLHFDKIGKDGHIGVDGTSKEHIIAGLTVLVNEVAKKTGVDTINLCLSMAGALMQQSKKDRGIKE